MPVTKVLRSNSAGANLSYILNGPAHNKNLTNHRVLNVQGHNVDLDYANRYNSRYLAAQYQVTRHKTKSYRRTHKDKRTQCEHLIISFSNREFDCSDLSKQSQQALELVTDWLGKYLPVSSQWTAVMQADGRGEMLHCHVSINSVNRDGKVLNTRLMRQTGKDNMRDNFNDYLDQNFARVTTRKFSRVVPKKRDYNDIVTANEKNMAKYRNLEPGKIWKDDLKERILKAFQATDNLEDFQTVLEEEYHVKVKHKQRPTGKVDANGRKIKRDSFTYVFIDRGGTQRQSVDYYVTTRGKLRGLGLDYTPKSLLDGWGLKEQAKQTESVERPKNVVPEQTDNRVELQAALQQLKESDENEFSEQQTTEDIRNVKFDDFDTSKDDEWRRNVERQNQRRQRQRRERVEAERDYSQQSEFSNGRAEHINEKPNSTEPEHQSTTEQSGPSDEGPDR